VFEQKRYPHLLPQDTPVLTAFLIENGHKYTRVDFDVRVGAGRDPGPDFDDNIRKDGLDLSRRRIDALCTNNDTVDIVEVTGAAGTTALGQLLSYRELYIIDHPHSKRPRLIIAARTMQTDMTAAYAASGIVVHLYPGAVENA